jgi:hypothetical protein
MGKTQKLYNVYTTLSNSVSVCFTHYICIIHKKNSNSNRVFMTEWEEVSDDQKYDNNYEKKI